MNKLIGLLFLIALFGCKKNSSGENASMDYYFDCTLQGRNIHSVFSFPSSNPIGIAMQSSVSTAIEANISSSQCNTSGTYCYGTAFRIVAQQTGNFMPETFAMQLTQGQDVYTYISCSYCTYNSGSMKITITKIERPQNYSSKGKLEGNFSGTILSRRNNDTTTNAIIPIAGKFLLPLD